MPSVANEANCSLWLQLLGLPMPLYAHRGTKTGKPETGFSSYRPEHDDKIFILWCSLPMLW